MAMIHCYIAASLDGYIAEPDGGVGWLDPFNALDYGYKEFVAGLSGVAMGRHTYEQCLTFGAWPYPGKRCWVVTSRPFQPASPDTLARPADFAALAAEWRAYPQGDIWLVGGASLLQGMLSIGGLDRLELFIMPTLLGDGIPLFAKGGLRQPTGLKLDASQSHPNGVVRLLYSL